MQRPTVVIKAEGRMGIGSWVERPRLKVGKGYFAGLRGNTEEME